MQPDGLSAKAYVSSSKGLCPDLRQGTRHGGNGGVLCLGGDSVASTQLRWSLPQRAKLSDVLEALRHLLSIFNTRSL
jgi:hypothetical protein